MTAPEVIMIAFAVCVAWEAIKIVAGVVFDWMTAVRE
jgi:hypothetical protein